MGPTYSVEVEVYVDLEPARKGFRDGDWRPKPVYQIVETENGTSKVVARWTSRACANRDRVRFANRAAEMAAQMSGGAR